MSDTEYRQKLYEIDEVPCADELVVGDVRQCCIGWVQLTGPQKMLRGTLLMKSGEEFVAATAGASGADEVCILAEDAELPDGEECKYWSYFGGVFKGSAVILPYEAEGDDHAELLSALEGTFRKQKIRIM